MQARSQDQSLPAVLVVMGVSGSGKSTIAAMLAHRLHWIYEDGDWFHPQSNIEKMHHGEPLNDADRWPWLHAIADWIDATRRNGQHLPRHSCRRPARRTHHFSQRRPRPGRAPERGARRSLHAARAPRQPIQDLGGAEGRRTTDYSFHRSPPPRNCRDDHCRARSRSRCRCSSLSAWPALWRRRRNRFKHD
jgi:hypothetical protein